MHNPKGIEAGGDFKAATRFLKVYTPAISYDTHENQHSHVFMPYASQYVRNHLSKSTKVSL